MSNNYNKKKINMTIGRFQPFTKGHLNMIKSGSENNTIPCIIYQIKSKDIPESLKGWKVGSKVVKKAELENILKYVNNPESVSLTEHENDIIKRPFSNGLVAKELEIVKQHNKQLVYDVVYVTNMFDAIIHFNNFITEHNDEYEPNYLICGDDRANSYEKTISKYDEIESEFGGSVKVKNLLKDSIKVFNVKRDNISGTAVRYAIITNNKSDFYKMMPEGVGSEMWDDFKVSFDEFINNLNIMIKEQNNNLSKLITDALNKEMLSLDTYIYDRLLNESKTISMWSKTLLSPGNFAHNGDYKYILMLLDDLINKKDMQLYMLSIADPNKYSINISDLNISKQDMDSLKHMYDNISDYTYHDFNNIMKKYGVKWQDINKAQFSGVTSLGNLGNQFEAEFIKNFHDIYEKQIKDIVGYEELRSISAVGELNNKRPVHFENGEMTVSQNNSNDIGAIVSDVTLETDKGPVYLSLKYGNEISFVNMGLFKTIPKTWYQSETEELSKNGEIFIDTLGLDVNKYKGVFFGKENTTNKTRKRNGSYVLEDVTKHVLQNNKFINFIKSTFGYGYIIVHKYKNGKVEFTDLRTEEQLNNKIKNIKSVTIKYGVDVKRVEIIINLDDNNGVKCIIRAANGGLEPDKFQIKFI